MSDRTVNTQTKRVKEKYNQNVSNTGIYVPAGVYIGKVVSNTGDDNLKGRVKVHISRLNAAVLPADREGITEDVTEESQGYYWCKRVMPYAGVSGSADAGDELGYGMFGPAPQKGEEVLVSFTGESVIGYMIGVIPRYLPQGNTSGTTSSGDFVPTYDTKDPVSGTANPHPLAEDLRNQGLDRDSVRGANLSEHTRDSTTRTLNITTPSGHSIIMDDGSEEDQQSNVVRIRTAGGAQFLMDDRNGFIYMINRSGNGWFEINRNGDFNIFSEGSVNIHANGSFNVHANSNINMQADIAMNFKAQGEDGIKFDAAAGPINAYSNTDMNLSADGNGNIRIAGNLKQSADRIDLNGSKQADAADKPAVIKLIENKNVTESIAEVVPEREPWRGHIDYGEYADGGSGELTDTTSAAPGARITDETIENSYTPADDNFFTSGLASFDSSLDSLNRKINPEVLSIVEKVAIGYGIPLSITKGSTSPDTQAGIVSNTPFNLGNAVRIRRNDGSPISKRDLDIIARLASESGVGGFGVYPESLVNETVSELHFDIGSKRAWGPNNTNSSLPQYARDILGKYGW